MLVSQAFAQTAQAVSNQNMSTGSDMMSMAVQFILIILIVYFLLIRPQQKRIKQHEMELNAIIKGTKIIVAGLVGTVVEVLEDNKLCVELADGVQVTVMRPYVSQVIFDTPASTKKKKA